MHESALGDDTDTVGGQAIKSPAIVSSSVCSSGPSHSGSSRTNSGAPRVPGTPMAVHIDAAPSVASSVPPPNRSPKSRQLAVSSSPMPAPGSSRRGSTLFAFPWSRPANGKRQTSTELQPAHATAAAAAATTSPPSSAAATVATPRRRWFRYPVRVPILSLLLVSLLARTSEGWTSICGFLCGFLLFEGFSAPETGHPNRFDTLMRKCTNSVHACRKRRRKRAAGSLARRRMSAQGGLGSVAAHATQESFRKRVVGRLLSWIRSPFRACIACCRRRAKKNAATQAAARNSNTDSDDPASARPLLSENEAAAFSRPGNDDAATAASLAAAVAEEEESDVLLDVALSVTEDLEAPAASAATAGDPAAGTAAQTPVDAPITPLHPLTDLTDSSPALLLPSLPSLPTVHSLEPADLEDDPPAPSASGSGAGAIDVPHASSSNLGVTGGVVNFAHVSVSLRFTFRAYHIHLHHWLYLLIILLFLYMEQVWWKEHAASAPIYAFFSAFCLGGSVQGLKYADWHRVVWRKVHDAMHVAQGAAAAASSSAAAPAAASTAAPVAEAAVDSAPSSGRTSPVAAATPRTHSRMHSARTSSMTLAAESAELERLEGGEGRNGARDDYNYARIFETLKMPTLTPLSRQSSHSAQLNMHG